jgi:hypothetical protein
MDVKVDTLAADSGRITDKLEIILSWRYQPNLYFHRRPLWKYA